MLSISDNWLESAQLTEQEARIELALALLRSRRISFEQAQELVGLETLAFLRLLDLHGVVLEYDRGDLQQDIATLQSLRQL
jgi:predicted HTH domain antitoxin